VEAERITTARKKVAVFPACPSIRGIFNFVSSLVVGNRVLMRSAEVAEGDTEQPSKSRKMAGGKT